MAEKMLVTQALDERDLLEKKIKDKIARASFVDCIKRNEERVIKIYKEKTAYIKEVEAAYQQITDLIARYDRLSTAINHSNANTHVETSYGTYTVADAIALRARLKGSGNGKDLDFETILYDKLGEDYATAVVEMDKRNQQLKGTAENMRLSILGKEAKAKEEKPLAVVEAYVTENATDLVDPLDALKRMMVLKEKHDTFLKELETGIKVSNATTFIET